jgi:hypothetical protein
MSQLRWFIGVLVLGSRVDQGAVVPPLIDLQYRLIRAADAESAYDRALELGRQAGHEYRNAAGEQVFWQFVGLRDLREVDDAELSDGTEVYGYMVRAEPEQVAVPKERLSVFWAEANKHRTAQELLEPE